MLWIGAQYCVSMFLDSRGNLSTRYTCCGISLQFTKYPVWLSNECKNFGFFRALFKVKALGLLNETRYLNVNFKAEI